jgi:4-diphosphocytidyl-2-C-methyl-D-erythritol kinase
VTAEVEALRLTAPAKVNLFLHVGDKRADGFHALQSLVAFTRLGDELAFAPDAGLTLALRGPFAGALEQEADNLVLKAARALQAHAGVSTGARIVLTKNLPVASGIGGGSSDAAAALRGLVRLWKLKTGQDALRRIAETLGSDVPVCVSCAPQWMEGRGEVLTALGPIPPMPIVLVNPGVGVPTGKVFAALKERRGTGLDLQPRLDTPADLIAYLEGTANDLEAPARAIAPVVGDVLAALSSQEGVLLFRMSGSGATCFALFGKHEAAAAAAREIGRRRPKWWIAATEIAAAPQ